MNNVYNLTFLFFVSLFIFYKFVRYNYFLLASFHLNFSIYSIFIYILLCSLYFIYLFVYIFLFIYLFIYLLFYLFIQLIFFHNFNQIFIYLNVSIIRFQMGTHWQRSSCHLKAMACFYHAAVAQEGLKKGDR